MAKKKTVVMLILDGWGLGAKNPSNPIYNTPTPTFDYIRTYYTCGALQSAGIAVGLPWGEEGDSEVGHMTLGAGKVLYQHYPRITMAIKNGSFFKNEALLSAVNHVKKSGGKLHLIGLFGKGNVHSSYDHIIALLKLCTQENFDRVHMHLFADGRDSPPTSGNELIEAFQKDMEKIGAGSIASITGRYYAMDRDDHWDRTEKTYKALTGEASVNENIDELFTSAYNRVHSDEFVEPTVIDPGGCIQDNDAIIFFDFREDAMRQITAPFINSEFEEFETKNFQNLHVVTMTRYRESYDVPVAFLPETVNQPLGKVLADNGKIQLRIAETEKYAHATYFFNGLRDAPYKNEYRVLVPSKNVPRHEEHPDMQTEEITNRLLEALEERVYDFILVNFAASDIIAHSGNFEAAQVSIKTINDQLTRVIEAVQKTDSVLIVTADHGNLEQMLNPFTGEPQTKHTSNPVPLYIIGNDYVQTKDKRTAEAQERETVGILSDIAPTILEIMDIEKPEEMTGDSILTKMLMR